MIEQDSWYQHWASTHTYENVYFYKQVYSYTCEHAYRYVYIPHKHMQEINQYNYSTKEWGGKRAKVYTGTNFCILLKLSWLQFEQNCLKLSIVMSGNH